MFYVLFFMLHTKFIFSDEVDNNKPKNWYKIEPFNNIPHEVATDMHKNESINRISVSVDHELTIHHIIIEDSGIYNCRSLQEDINDNFLNYIVEVSYNATKKIEKGNMSHWKQYHDDYVIPINKILLSSKDGYYSFIRHNLSTNLELITHWEQKFRSCEVCGRPQGEGLQEKYGYCRIKIENDDKIINELPILNASDKTLNQNLRYFLSLAQVSCNSLLLKELFPNVSQRTETLADFVLVRKCDGVCNPDAGGVNQGWKFGSSKKYKYRRTTVLKEGEHLTLVCPESNLDNKIIWRRNGKVLEQSETDQHTNINEIHRIVDAFNSLYLLNVTSDESGNYTCQVDDIRMQQIRIYVVTKSRLLTEALARHMMYLAIILILSCMCYWAGCIAACKRKHKFKGYEEVLICDYACDCNSPVCRV